MRHQRLLEHVHGLLLLVCDAGLFFAPRYAPVEQHKKVTDLGKGFGPSEDSPLVGHPCMVFLNACKPCIKSSLSAIRAARSTILATFSFNLGCLMISQEVVGLHFEHVLALALAFHYPY